MRQPEYVARSGSECSFHWHTESTRSGRNQSHSCSSADLQKGQHKLAEKLEHLKNPMRMQVHLFDLSVYTRVTLV